MRSLQPLIDKAAKDRAILAVFLFGSHARGEAGPGSDVDICLALVPGIGPEAAFDKRLEYMSEFEIDAHVYQSVPLYVRRRILKEGKVLFCRDEELLYEIACRTITEFADFEHFYREYLKEIARG